MMDTSTDPAEIEILSRHDAEIFTRTAKVIFDTMGEVGTTPKVLVMEPNYNESERVCQIHFVCFTKPPISGTAEEVPGQSE